ncbi:MAG: V-type ATP synthase subunit E [Candidatus Scalinduaceae bacterium]
MSLERIKDSILNDAKKEAEIIIKDAKERFQEKIIQERDKIEEGFKEKYLKLSKKLKEDKNRKLIKQATNYKMELLHIKNNIIEEVFKKAADKFMSDEEYWRAMEKWLKDINEPGRIFVNVKDSRRLKQELINRILKNDEIVMDNNNIDTKGGFVFKTARFEIDHTMDTILSNLRTELTPLIAKELFGD